MAKITSQWLGVIRLLRRHESPTTGVEGVKTKEGNGSANRFTRAFPSADALLASESISETRCLVLDIALPGMSGPDLQQELARRRQEIPIVFITGTADDTVRLRVLARGAVDCLSKPFTETALLDALNAALRLR
jgi:FixJ family two-component response regulator